MTDVDAIIVLADVIAIDGWRNAIQIYVDDVISTWFLADVIANSVMWLMLLPIVWCGWCYYYFGRCYSQ